MEDEDEVVPDVEEEESVLEVQPQLTDEQACVMKIAELKDALGLHNLSKSGRKPQILEGISSALHNNAPMITNQTPKQTANMARSIFSSNANWSLLKPDNEVIGQDDLQNDTDGHQCCPPVAGLPENEDNNLGTKKRNYKEEFDRPPFVQ